VSSSSSLEIAVAWIAQQRELLLLLLTLELLYARHAAVSIVSSDTESR